MEFVRLQKAVHKQLEKMSKGDLFRTKVSGDSLWNLYLESFPKGTNPIFRERREYDCNCCKNFIRAAGNIVSIVGNKLVSIWDIEVKGEPNFQVVVDALAQAVKSRAISEPLVRTEAQMGAKVTRQMLEDGTIKNWDHFHYKLPKKFVKSSDDIGKYLSQVNATAQVFQRSLEEISLEAVETVLELISQNSLYRGEEHKRTLMAFRNLKRDYDKLNGVVEEDCFIWKNTMEVGMSLRIRNTAIGTLLVDLSKGDELDKAVTSFEEIVAGRNYKRSKSLVTNGMIRKAEKKVDELGLASALPRRHAKIDDITINNVLWADRTAKKAMSVFDELAEEVQSEPLKFNKVEEVHINDFMEKVLPEAKTIEIQVENKHEGNLMSLIAPVNPDVERLFKWHNNFSWAYNGDVTDSDLRQEVIARGGKIGVFRFSHSWNHDGNNQSLMDLHVFMPGNTKKFDKKCNNEYGRGRRVGWNQRGDYHSGGRQDVDFTARAGNKIPVENITFPSLDKMPDGLYRCAIHNWSFRPTTTSGFKAEIEFGGEIHQYEYPPALQHYEWVHVADVTKKNGKFTIDHKLKSNSMSKEIWGINTNRFHKVRTVMYSPNHWDGEETGNRHWFFMIENCKNPDKVRGFFNEFLKPELYEDRKVFEVLGSKMKADFQEDQLSGLGFSSTKRNSVFVRVTGKSQRVIKLVF